MKQLAAFLILITTTAAWGQGTWTDIGALTDAGGFTPVTAICPRGDETAFLVGGRFDDIDSATEFAGLAVYTVSSRTWTKADYGLALSAGGVTSIVWDATGDRWIIGGTFVGKYNSGGAVVQSATIINVCQYDDDSNTISGLATGIGQTVTALEVAADGTIYAGLTGAGYASNMMKWTGAAWENIPDGPASPDTVYALSLNADDSVLLVGGSFSAVGESSQAYLMSFTTVDDATNVSMAEPDGYVYAIEHNGSSWVLGGAFSNIGGSPYSHIASYNGSAFSAIGTNIGGDVHAIYAPDSSTLSIGGEFAYAGNSIYYADCRKVAYWDSNWLPFDEGIQGTGTVGVYAIGGYDSDRIIGGNFTDAFGGAPDLVNIGLWAVANTPTPTITNTPTATHTRTSTNTPTSTSTATPTSTETPTFTLIGTALPLLGSGEGGYPAEPERGQINYLEIIYDMGITGDLLFRNSGTVGETASNRPSALYSEQYIGVGNSVIDGMLLEWDSGNFYFKYNNTNRMTFSAADITVFQSNLIFAGGIGSYDIGTTNYLNSPVNVFVQAEIELYGNGILRFDQSDGAQIQYTDADDKFYFTRGNTTPTPSPVAWVSSLDGSAQFGNGLGVNANPTAQATPKGANAIIPIIVKSSGASNDAGMLLRNSDQLTGLDVWADGNTGDSYIENLYNNTAGDIIFRTKALGTAVTNMIITGAGDVVVYDSLDFGPSGFIGLNSAPDSIYVLDSILFSMAGPNIIRFANGGDNAEFAYNSTTNQHVFYSLTPTPLPVVAIDVDTTGTNRLLVGNENQTITVFSEPANLTQRAGGTAYHRPDLGYAYPSSAGAEHYYGVCPPITTAGSIFESCTLFFEIVDASSEMNAQIKAFTRSTASITGNTVVAFAGADKKRSDLTNISANYYYWTLTPASPYTIPVDAFLEMDMELEAITTSSNLRYMGTQWIFSTVRY